MIFDMLKSLFLFDYKNFVHKYKKLKNFLSQTILLKFLESKEIVKLKFSKNYIIFKFLNFFHKIRKNLN